MSRAMPTRFCNSKLTNGAQVVRDVEKNGMKFCLYNKIVLGIDVEYKHRCKSSRSSGSN
jgi:hypothetical protein